MKVKKHFKKVFFLFLISFFSYSSYGQNEIFGNVKDKNNSPIPGVNIIVKGTSSIGTTTDFDGKFKLETAQKIETLIVSYIGYKTKEVPVQYGKSIDIILIEDSAGLEEVIITSRKSVENQQEVPISVSAFSAKSLASKGISSIDQLAAYIPNVEIDVHAPFSGSSAVLSPFIRGIGQSDFAINFDPGVGLYIDGVYYARSLGSIVDLLDIERVEVLKGPQGTLFGRNTIGGAINVVTKNPIGRFSAFGEITTGSYNRKDSKMTVQFPIVEDKLAASFSFSSKNRDGYVKRIPFKGAHNSDLAQPGDGEFPEVGLNNDQGNQNNDTWRGKLSWKPSDKYTLNISADLERVRENQNASSLLRVNLENDGLPNILGLYNLCAQGLLPPELCNNIAGAPGLELTGRTPFDDRFITGDPFTTYGTGDGGTVIDSWGTSITQELELSENISLKSITAYRKLESRFGEDQDNSPIPVADLGFEMPAKQFSQEFQLSGKTEKMKWVTGLYYFNEEGSVTDKANLGGGLTQIFGTSYSTVNNYAAFGQFTYNLSDKFSFTGGLRFTSEKKTIESNESDPNMLLLKLGATTPTDYPTSDLTRLFPEGVFEQTFNEPTIRLGLEYKATEDIFIYGSFAQGFKSGGWTTRVTAPVLEAPEFKPEKANTYEIGFKSEFAEKTIRFNAALFYTDFQDLQVTVQRGISPFLENAAKATIKGLEFDVLWRASKNWLLSANAGWLDASYDKITDPAAVIKEDFKFANTPDFSGSISSDYTIPLGDKLGRFIWHLDASTKSEVYNDAENTPLLRQSGLTLLNSTLAFQSYDYNWKITVGGTNLTNETYLVSGFSIPAVGIAYGIHARPAEFNLGVSYKF